MWLSLQIARLVVSFSGGGVRQMLFFGEDEKPGARPGLGGAAGTCAGARNLPGQWREWLFPKWKQPPRNGGWI